MPHCYLQITIKGFVDNMPEWMTASDMIISKAGPGTIAESFICGLPVLLNGFVPCQEEGNVPFVLKNKVGLVTDDLCLAEVILALSQQACMCGRFMLTSQIQSYAVMA